MRWITLGIIFLSLSNGVSAADFPLVEKDLHSGQFATGENALKAALAISPKDDQIRFGLGVLQMVRGVERLGQSLYRYGCASRNTQLPFVRLPIPVNPNPAPISYEDFRRLLADFYGDLTIAEATLAGITDDNVTLPLRLAEIHLDLDGDGKSKDRFIDILKKLAGRNVGNTKNAEFLVRFDRGDVAWMRAYCHLLMGMLDFQLALDLEQTFDVLAGELFGKPRKPEKGKLSKDWQHLNAAWKTIAVKEPARLNQMRKHLMAVCELNAETWKYIRQERDNDYEWLPNVRQTSVLGLPVNDAMIDVWLGMMEEFHALLDGKKVVPAVVLRAVGPEVESGLNLRKLLEDPPQAFQWERIAEEGPADKYLDKTIPDVDSIKIMRVPQMFRDTLGMGYAAWFN